MTTTLESPDQLAAALDELAESPKLDRHEALAAKQAASVIREQHLALEAACQMEQASGKRIGELVALLAETQRLILRLTRMLEAVRYTAGLGKTQMACLEAAQALHPKLNEALK